jgi:ribonuclease Z
MTSKINLSFLGTSAQIPTSKRNHTAMLLQYNEENILVDCGEGTQRQFRKARLNPNKVTRILITHWHGDHVFGLPGILSTLSLSDYNKTLYIYGPKGTKEFIRELLKMFNFKRNYEIKVEDVSGKFFETKDFYLEAKAMKHGIPTNAYCFVEKSKMRIDKAKLKKSGLPFGPLLSKIKDGKDVSYGGEKFKAKDLLYGQAGKKVCFVLDTLDNENIVGFAKDSDLLISESSFSSDDKIKAKEHLHLTAEQAGKIAKKAKVKKLILTHVSQRYEKDLKSFLKDAKKEFKNVEIAEDLKEIELK